MVPGVRWLTPVALALALAPGGCGDEPPQAGGQARTQPDEERAPGSAPSEDDAPPDPAPAEVPWAPGTMVLETGKAPAPLAVAPDLGTTRPLVLVVEASAGPKKRARRWPRVRLTGAASLTSTSADASRRTLSLSTMHASPNKAFDDAILQAMEAQLPVGGDQLELVTDGRAAVTSMPWPTTTDPIALEVGHAVSHALSHMTLPLPSEPVGRGGRIEIRRTVSLMGLPMRQTLALRVDKVQGKQLELSGDVTYTLDPDAPATAGLGLPVVEAARGSGKFFLRLHRPSASPIEMNIVIDLVATGPEGEQKIWLDLRVDEDYLATPDRRVRFSGQFTQGGLVIGHVAPQTKVWFNKRRTKVSKAGDFVLGMRRTAKDRALLSFQFPGADAERHVVQVSQRAFSEERIDGLPPEMVDLDRAAQRALGISRRRVAKLRKRVTREPYFAAGFRWPMKGRITSTYGRQRFLNGDARGPHWGVDIAAPVGRSVKAPAAGVVVLADNDVPLSGNLLILDHGHGLTSAFLHLAKFKVAVGDIVSAGQVIATAGNSGRTTGPHLDWRMNLRDIRVDPQTIVGPR